MSIELFVGDELPDITLTWPGTTVGSILNLTGHTFTLKFARRRGAQAAFTKTSGITGASTDPNVTIAFDPDELDLVKPGDYLAQITARSALKDRTREFDITILAKHQ